MRGRGARRQGLSALPGRVAEEPGGARGPPTPEPAAPVARSPPSFHGRIGARVPWPDKDSSGTDPDTCRPSVPRGVTQGRVRQRESS